MNKSFLILVCAIFVSIACPGQTSFSQNSLQNPAHFAEGIIETSADEYNPVLTPDGKTVYFTRRADRRGNETIMVSRFENGQWSMPKTAEFSGRFSDKEPFVAPDGKRIFFASTRPNGRDEKNNYDIWYVEKTANGWSEARNLGTNVNSPGYDNYPSVAADGTLYFGSVRTEGRKDNDLYRARFANGQYQPAENIGDAINTAATEADPFIAPDQSYLIVCSDRAGGAGEGDLYVSFNRKGSWTAPQSLGKTINTAEYEYTPFVSADGKTFYFSRGWGEIFQVDASVLNLSALKPTTKHDSLAVNTKQKYLFYLHGKIVEDQGVKAVSERYGAYEYEKIIEGFRAEGFNVVSEARPANTDVEKYAGKVAGQIRRLLKTGVPPQNITVAGASKGAFITMLASTYLRNKRLNFVIVAGCGADKGFLKLVNLHGNILSIYEKSDGSGTCQPFFDDATGLNKRKEVMINTGLAHGFLYRPLREWLVPTLDWANFQK